MQHHFRNAWDIILGVHATSFHECMQRNFRSACNTIVAKKWDPGILDPGRFSAQIRKVEARLGNLAKIRKVETNLESSSKRFGKLGKFFWKIRKIRKVH